MSFVERHALWNDAQHAAFARAKETLRDQGIELVRFSFADQHGVLRGKTLVTAAAADAMQNGVAMVSTLLLKDTAHKTAFKVFDAGDDAIAKIFEGAADVVMVADPTTFTVLPWADKTAWVQCEAYFASGQPVPFDTRQILKRTLKEVERRGWRFKSGIEVEFYLYKLLDAPLDPHQAAWPPLAPRLAMVHPGYNVLTEQMADLADAPLRIVQRTAQALGMPLRSLEIELGPSQVEAVFDVQEGLASADLMVLFRSSVKQALQRAGYHATFMCRPPFESVIGSGWHLHQSLADAKGVNVFARTSAASDAPASSALAYLSETGSHYLGGLLAHAQALAALATPTINGYSRYQPNVLAPCSVIWGRDNRGALLRVVGGTQAGDAAARIENRMGEPLANPYLYMASQLSAGLDGIERALDSGPACATPYSNTAPSMPSSLNAALEALRANQTLRSGLGSAFVDYFRHIKAQEIARNAQALAAGMTPQEWEAREYLNLY
ncbi:MAG: glutamine synthetase family protein [Burkholderiaceae bacterium]